MGEIIPTVENQSRSPFLTEFDRLSKEIRPTFFKPEVVKALNVSHIQTTPVADSLFDKKMDGTPIINTLLVGTDPSATHLAAIKNEQVKSKYTATPTDGRVVRLDFQGDVVEVPGLHNGTGVNENEKIIARDETIVVPIEGVAIKGPGRSFNFNVDIPYGIRTNPGIGGVSSERVRYGERTHRVDVIGGANLEHQVYERDLLVDYLSMGARVDVPILTANVEERQTFKLGLLALGYRTPFNFEHFSQALRNEPNKHKYLMMHGINVWRREGLINNKDLDAIFIKPIGYSQEIEQSRKLLEFYIKNGSRIAGADLAIIHKKGSIGNRIPQNMGNDFSHRDLGDAQNSNIANAVVDKALGGNDLLGKFNDIYDDLKLVQFFVSRENPEVGNSYYYPEAVYEYLKAYFQKPGGMTEREFNACLSGKKLNILDTNRDPDLIKIIRKAYKRVVLENKKNKRDLDKKLS